MKVNLGCGMKYLDGYINSDFSDTGSNGSLMKVDETYNFLDGIPYADDSVEEIIFTDVLEHFNRWNGLKILKEIYRVLQPGGKLILTVPPALNQMQTLINQMKSVTNITMEDFFDAHKVVSFWKWHYDVSGATHESDGFDGDSHKTFYTIHSLRPIMQHVGFKITEESPDVIMIKATK